jgi:hypothetical protein
MIAFTFICLLPAALFFAAIPIVLFGLMLETGARRASQSRAAGQGLSGSLQSSLGTTVVRGLQLS